ncbi:MAG: hypothetical protein JO358_09965 [Alphaproteobacteria bacterium]|nr:hypothetical protein [Alphaproteobacteria bacterium]
MRNIRAINRVDLDHDNFAGIAFVDEREQRRITHIAAVPISLAINFPRL